ncbi:heat shock protein 40 like protein/ DnaJ domain-containing protein [Tribonema minus]|uniref:Heat shock protein 40 like protein/ DnaJ domain-containing protein n=1 Tax=Tribonema minus TaxID=303371 RepID=A0A835YSJ5_9STRA|nr:heat shock protein 40 like protein/ DnaJ domain-containing protein [Tribonema minus]
MLAANGRCLLLVLLGFAAAAKIKDPHGIFCGKDNCYEVLAVPRNATKDEIRRSYRALSLENHPDKNLKKRDESKEKFARIAKAYEVLTNSTKREEFDFHLDHPDAYWIKYGSHVVYKYAPESDVRFVLLGLLLAISALGYGLQYNKYQRAVKFVIAAADANLRTTQGGNAMTLAVRREAEGILAERQKARQEAAAATKPAKGTPKPSRKEIMEEQAKELRGIIEELAMKVEIKGAHRKPTIWDVPAVWLCLAPLRIARRCAYFSRWLMLSKLGGRPLPVGDIEYWTVRAVGKDTWDAADEAARKEAIQTEAWRDATALATWRATYVEGAPLASKGSGRRKSKSSPRQE